MPNGAGSNCRRCRRGPSGSNGPPAGHSAAGRVLRNGTRSRATGIPDRQVAGRHAATGMRTAAHSGKAGRLRVRRPIGPDRVASVLTTAARHKASGAGSEIAMGAATVETGRVATAVVTATGAETGVTAADFAIADLPGRLNANRRNPNLSNRSIRRCFRVRSRCGLFLTSPSSSTKKTSRRANSRPLRVRSADTAPTVRFLQRGGAGNREEGQGGPRIARKLRNPNGMENRSRGYRIVVFGPASTQIPEFAVDQPTPQASRSSRGGCPSGNWPSDSDGNPASSRARLSTTSGQRSATLFCSQRSSGFR